MCAPPVKAGKVSGGTSHDPDASSQSPASGSSPASMPCSGVSPAQPTPLLDNKPHDNTKASDLELLIMSSKMPEPLRIDQRSDAESKRAVVPRASGEGEVRGGRS